MEQSRGLTYRNRIWGNPGRTSELKFAKSASIKGQGCKSGGRAVKTVKLTSGGLRRVVDSRLSVSQGRLTAAQKSAEGVVPASDRRSETLVRKERNGQCPSMPWQPGRPERSSSARTS